MLLKFVLLAIVSFASHATPIENRTTELGHSRNASDVKPERLNAELAGNTTRSHELKINKFCKREVLLNETREVELLLSEYYNQLRRYIVNGFDERKFVLVSIHLREELNELGDMVNALPCNRVISAQLRFIKLVFRMMINAVESLRFFHLGRLSQSVVRAMIKLNLRLLSLHNSHGAPDPSLDNYSPVITRSRTLIQTWGQLFKTLKDEPSATWIMFRDQYFRAVKTLEFLESPAQWRPQGLSVECISPE